MELQPCGLRSTPARWWSGPTTPAGLDRRRAERRARAHWSRSVRTGKVAVGEGAWRSATPLHEPLGAVQVKEYGRPRASISMLWLGGRQSRSSSARVTNYSDCRGFDNAVAARGARLVCPATPASKTRLAAEFAHPARRAGARRSLRGGGQPGAGSIVEVLHPRDPEAEIPAGTAERAACCATRPA